MPQSEGGSIFQCGREISRQQLDEIFETVGLFPSLSRKELAATICEHLGWVTVTGSNKLDACMKLLEKLECKGLIRLPAKQEQYRRNRSQRPIILTSRTDRSADITGSIEDIGQVRFWGRLPGVLKMTGSSAGDTVLF